MKRTIQDYEDMLDLPHPVSTHHPQMDIARRAAQFAPFAALTGHDAAIRSVIQQHEERVNAELMGVPDDEYP